MEMAGGIAESYGKISKSVTVESLHSERLKRQSQLKQTTILIYFYFQKKTSLDISCELSTKQTIHMKYQDLFSLKNKK